MTILAGNATVGSQTGLAGRIAQDLGALTAPAGPGVYTAGSVGAAQVNALATGIVNNLNTDLIGASQIQGVVNRNAKQIAQLRWYEANQSGITYSTGNVSWGGFFDGTYIYVLTDSGYKRVDAQTGVITQYATGIDYDTGCFDGRDCWIISKTHGALYRVNVSSGSVVNTYSITYPTNICFDGKYLWTASWTGGSFITRIDPNSPTTPTTFSVPTGTNSVCFDGTYIWTGSASVNYVYKIKASDGSAAGTFATTGNAWRTCFDGTYVWMNPSCRIRVADNTTVSTINTTVTTWGMCFDGTYIWSSDYNGNTVTKIRSIDGLIVGVYSTSSHPTTLVFDGVNLWAVCSGVTNRL